MTIGWIATVGARAGDDVATKAVAAANIFKRITFLWLA
jgi:hypothetical protein